jgi:hypothetical protein
MTFCTTRRTLLLATAASLVTANSLARAPPGSDPNSPRGQWFAKQFNMQGGMCCALGDGHELAPGDVRFSQETGLWSVRLPDPNVATFGTTLDDQSTYSMPKQWVEIAPAKMRDPKGGPPPTSNPIIWYDTAGHGQNAYYSIYCMEPNPQL